MYCNQVIIIHRHADRRETSKFPKVEANITRYENVAQSGDLLDIGRINACKFGKYLQDRYRFSETPKIYTSEVPRCIHTAQEIIHGIGIDFELDYTHDPLLKEFIPKNISNIVLQTLIKQGYGKYCALFEEMGELLTDTSTDSSRLYHLYGIYANIQSYKTQGYDMTKYILPETEAKLHDALIDIYNTSQHINQLYIAKDISDYINNLFATNDNQLVLCSTHDTVVFLIAKYFTHKNGIIKHLELPEYLSNVRIEKWSDDTYKIYYMSDMSNDFYIGSVL